MGKSFDCMLFKQISHEIKDLDETQGRVIAYANAYGNEDYHGDISMPGSFLKTVPEMRKRIRVLKDHDTRMGLGVPKDINANDPYGLLTDTQFNLKKELARDMFTDIQLMVSEGLNADLSIGYDVVRRDENDSRKITEYRLWEYSFLTSWGANQLATVKGLKGISRVNGYLEILTKQYNLPYSDTRLSQDRDWETTS